MEKFNLKLFVSLALLTAIASFFVLFGNNQIYKTELDILILPRNEKMAESFDQTVESIKQLPLSLSFYNGMLAANKNIKDGAVGQSNYARKQFWNEKISAERIGESGVIRLEISDPNQAQSEVISAQLKHDLFFVISKYYNIKTDLEPRLIDGPITGAVAFSGIFISLLESIGLGAVFSFFMTIILSELFEAVSKRKMNSFNPQFSFKKNILPKMNVTKTEEVKYVFPEKKSAAEKALEEIENEEIAVSSEELPEEESASAEIKKEISSAIEPVRNIAKAGAPGNLPFADEELPDIFNTNKNEQVDAPSIEEAAKEDVGASYKEATPEEVKARLRKLLDGKF